uniref:DUF218 domain-containing protein n=1 Tax=Grammatophora oceanica TaxID=210454 RepID=A0A7S1Y322_9STRA|mmetsp:Transcript_14439/g.21183  ORF Transcript_14439/g.21183 Transcript_14439/m.21183 type:complete len:262 (+) Transcript_14439:121-906(+)|eukprot:CAMPEP_0194046928 /NCGR_PEP_ID=MMETSP0009_2-20130614/22991_1 /TAXON_ID=210454 /ORGANISM="Grammatophora oceanica, Strain CCMP 410" /LENGTH=261 /DNA_ID=CAMNT_0038692397 /DNA_START=119 /DNA_END=904 /DNA_ORIENTATION=-
MSSNSSEHIGKIFSSPSELPSDLSIDAILVLGGGVPTSLEEPPIYVQKRCDDAAAVIEQHSPDAAILTLSAGTAHLPQLLTSDGRPIWESTSSAAYLKAKHGITKNVYVETTSFDTIGNAYFTRTSHTDPAGWRKLLVITNQFHMLRSKAIFDWIFALDGGDSMYELYYLASEDVGLSETALKARNEHEAKGQKTVEEKLAPTYNSMSKVWEFLMHNHDLYTASKLIDNVSQAKFSEQGEALKESYGAGAAGGGGGGGNKN